MASVLSIVEFREVRCPTCGRLLFKVRGIAEIETVCPRCDRLVRWPNLDLAVVVREVHSRHVLAVEQFSTSPPLDKPDAESL